jgi:hypothetical protein
MYTELLTIFLKANMPKTARQAPLPPLSAFTSPREHLLDPCKCCFAVEINVIIGIQGGNH